MFWQGSLDIQDELAYIRDALLTKDGLVDAEKQDLFREQLNRTFNKYLAQNQTAQTKFNTNGSTLEFASIDRIITQLFRDLATNETLVELRR